MNINFQQRWSTMPPIPTERTISSHLKSQSLSKVVVPATLHNMLQERQLWIENAQIAERTKRPQHYQQTFIT